MQLNATNNFGPSGVFVNADNITITGLNLFLDPLGSQNKTVEVIGENFDTQYCRLTDGNSLYINDWRFNSGANTSHVTKYHVEGNSFENGTSVDIADGAGYSGSVSGRKILNNNFDGTYAGEDAYWALISFNGLGTGVPWYVHSVGGAVITGNTFKNSEQYIRHRGTVDNTQFDWSQYWTSNTFDKSVVTLENESTFTPRAYSYPNDYGTYNNVKRIGALIQADINNVAQNGDVVKVGAGTYNESVLVTKSLAFKGVKAGVLGKGRSGAESIIDPNTATAHGFKIVTDNVTIDGFTITNSVAYPSSERYGVVTIEKTTSGNFTGISVRNNIITRQFKAVNFNYTNNFEISRNWLHGEGNTYNYGCTWIDDYGTSSSNGTIKNNDLDGYSSAIEIQGDLTHPVSNITISENRSTGSQYVLFGLQSSNVYRNSALNVTTGSHIFVGGGCLGVSFSENFFDGGTSHGLRVSNDFGAGINSGITFNYNSITGHNAADRYEINVTATAYAGTLDATCNWYGTNDAAIIASKITGPVNYTPWLTRGTDNAPSTPGFQQNSCNGTPADNDGDGVPNATDCAPLDPNNSGTLHTYYKDDDKNGFGDPNDLPNTVCSATPPSGYADNDDDCDDTKITYADNDGDGYGAGPKAACGVTRKGDCKDDNNKVYPGAPELCDGLDNDCDNKVDEYLTKKAYYKDDDTDGYGDPKTCTYACTAPSGYVANNKDCNDKNNTIYPSAPELCDGLDNDCDGKTDEGLTQRTFYRDADGDGWGNSKVTKKACAAPPGYVSKKGDCNDNNKRTYPGHGCSTSMTMADEITVVEEEVQGALEARVAPNPATSYFTIRINGVTGKPVQLRVVDAAGRVQEARTNLAANTTVTFGHLYRPGIYFVEALQGTERVTVKCIKQ